MEEINKKTVKISQISKINPQAIQISQINLAYLAGSGIKPDLPD